MNEWTVVTSLSVIVGLAAALAGPVVKLNGTISRLSAILEHVLAQLSKLEREDEKLRARLQFLVDQFRPVRSRCRIVFLEECGGLDAFTYLDINGSVLQNTPGSLDDRKALTGMIYLE